MKTHYRIQAQLGRHTVTLYSVTEEAVLEALEARIRASKSKKDIQLKQQLAEDSGRLDRLVYPLTLRRQ